jgi:TRAP-type C4-dicarboxylate transport system permease small subunit
VRANVKPSVLGVLGSLLDRVNGVLVAISAIATGIAACVLTWEASARYLFKIPSIWQDDVAVFLLVGATFLSAAWVQARRGHVGIQALAAILPPHIDRVRLAIADFLTLLFVTFFAWKSWELLLEAIDEGRVTYSAWGAPMWVPFTCMSVGMSLVALQLLLQIFGVASRWHEQ